jgi:glutamyl/glutaminyl-tRNA synthetase
MRALRQRFATAAAFDKEGLEAALREAAEAHAHKPASLIHATRVAVTGRAVSPGLFEVIELVGRERTLARIDSVLA